MFKANSHSNEKTNVNALKQVNTENTIQILHEKMLRVAINTKKLCREMDTKRLLRAARLHGVAPLGLTVEPIGSLRASSCMQA
jgi:hypothetical protein